MPEQLHRLIDSKAEQPVINERVAGMFERVEGQILALTEIDRAQNMRADGHETRIAAIERRIAYILGAVALIVVLWELAKTGMEYLHR